MPSLAPVRVVVPDAAFIEGNNALSSSQDVVLAVLSLGERGGQMSPSPTLRWTSHAGRFVFENVPLGHAMVVGRTADGRCGKTAPFEVRGGARINIGKVSWTTGFPVVGTIATPAGPCPGATITAVASAVRYGGTTADEAGHFRLEGLPRGVPLSLLTSCKGRMPALTRITLDEAKPPPPLDLRVP